MDNPPQIVTGACGCSLCDWEFDGTVMQMALALVQHMGIRHSKPMMLADALKEMQGTEV